MMQRIVSTEDPALLSLFPAERFARVRITDMDGTVFVSPITAARGDPDSPLSDTELNRKFNKLAQNLGPDRSRKIAEEVANLEVEDRNGILADLVLSPIPQLATTET